jgi:hypothetical protein
VGTWGSAAINPDLTAVDGFLGGVQIISAAASPITLTVPAGFTATPSGGPTQAQNAVLRFTGTLTASVQVTLPMPGPMIVENLTTGAFVLTFRAIGSGEIIAVDQGDIQRIYNDGTNVRFVGLPNVGTYIDDCGSAVPAWIAACTKPPFLNCDGTTFNATTFPYLNAKLGGNTLPDLRGVARYTLNQGTGRLTTAGSGLDGTTRFANKFTQTYTLVLANLPAYTPAGTITNGAITGTVNNFLANAQAAGGGGNAGTFSSAVTPSQAASTFTGTPQGGTSTAFGVIGTGTIAGITMIRAA